MQQNNDFDNMRLKYCLEVERYKRGNKTMITETQEERTKRLNNARSTKWAKDNREKYNAYKRAYANTPEYKAYQKAYHKEYMKAHQLKMEVKERAKSYRQTPNGKEHTAKYNSYRKRNMGHELLNDWFVGCEQHHINAQQVVCMPKDIHRLYRHNHKKPETMENVNGLAMQYLFNCKR